MSVDKIKAGLNWRGPTGKTAGHIVLTRAEANSVLAEVEAQRAEIDRLLREIELKQSRE